ncbi:hypothetical protein CHARACLAT_021680 [Characodon lateralis]|uniref:Uncharacterized protein n=1 Tax=Characodon lateralis TaxID=208331 RepID=A0ABU7F5E7_9TELE|nr:hypothetical protein [Characodon lateralis]
MEWPHQSIKEKQSIHFQPLFSRLEQCIACGAENDSDCPPAASPAWQWGGANLLHAELATTNDTGVGVLHP